MLLFLAWVRVPRSWHDCWNDGTHLEVFNDSYQLEVDGEEIRVILGSFTYPQSNRSKKNRRKPTWDEWKWNDFHRVKKVILDFTDSLSLRSVMGSKISRHVSLTNKMQNEKQLNGSLRFSRASEWLLGIMLNSHWLPLKFSHALIAHFGNLCFSILNV